MSATLGVAFYIRVMFFFELKLIKMDKNILKKIAKEWAKGILLATEAASFCEETEEYLTQDEEGYIVNEVHKIAERITKEDYSTSLVNIIKKYYTTE